MSQTRISYIYNPSHQTAEQLIDNFVIRTKEFRAIRRSIRESGLSSAPKHFLIEGQRGTGKTSLLLRLRYDLTSEGASAHLVPVQLTEEQYNVYDLCRLWEHIAEYLDDIPGFEGSSELLDRHSNDNDYPAICYELVDKQLVKNKKRLVLLLDNLGDMLTRLSDVDQKRLRDILLTSKYIQLIAASAGTMEHNHRYDKPFYEFFKIIRLKGLDQVDTFKLLKQLGKAHNHEATVQRIIDTEPQRIETMRRLTNGVPRTVILLYEILLDESANVFEDVEIILDKVTPLYKHRMDDLPTQQQAIMDAIALNWDGISFREIAERLKSNKFESREIAAQLEELEKYDLVVSKFVDPKYKIYFVAERFFNIWYLMRCGRKKSRIQVEWLINFLQEWCSPEDLERRALTQIEHAKRQTLHSQGGYYMAASLLSDPSLQDELLTSTRSFLETADKQLVKSLSASCKELITQANISYEQKQYSEAITLLNKVQSFVLENTVPYLIGLCYSKLNDDQSAIEYYRKAIEQGHAGAMNNLAEIYEKKRNETATAIHYYAMAVEKGHAGASYNLALLYQNDRNYIKKAISFYKIAIEQGHAGAMNKLALLYYEENCEKRAALVLISRAISLTKDKKNLGSLAIVALWNEAFQKSHDAISEFLSLGGYHSFTKFLTDYFVLLLAKNQYQAAFKLFDN